MRFPARPARAYKPAEKKADGGRGSLVSYTPFDKITQPVSQNISREPERIHRADLIVYATQQNEMIIAKVVLSQILVTANGKNKFALGLDASQLDQVSQDNQLAVAVDSFVHDKAGNTGKPKSLRGIDGVINTNALTEIGSNNADGTVPAAKIWIERSKRLVARVS